MPDEKVIKKLQEQNKKLIEEDEIPIISVEMATEIKNPELAPFVLKHDGKPEKKEKARSGQTKIVRCFECGRPAGKNRDGAPLECFHHKTKYGKVFPLCGGHASIGTIQSATQPSQNIVMCTKCQHALWFGEDRGYYDGGHAMDEFPKQGQIALKPQEPIVVDMGYDIDSGYAYVAWQIPNFELKWTWNADAGGKAQWFINGLPVGGDKIDKMFPTRPGAVQALSQRSYSLLSALDPVFKADVQPPIYEKLPDSTDLGMGGKHVVLQADRKDHKDPAWVTRRKIQDAQTRLDELRYRHTHNMPEEKAVKPEEKPAPPPFRRRRPGEPFKPPPKPPEPEKTKAPDKTFFDMADKLADATWWGANSSGDVGDWRGIDRVPPAIKNILENPANWNIEPKRHGWRWDVLSPYMFMQAYNIMLESWKKNQARFHANEKEQATKKP
jgi:hypothetical protein